MCSSWLAESFSATSMTAVDRHLVKGLLVGFALTLPLVFLSADWPTGVTILVLLVIGVLSGIVSMWSESGGSRPDARPPRR